MNSDYNLLSDKELTNMSSPPIEQTMIDKSTQTPNNDILSYDNNDCCSNSECVSWSMCCFLTIFLCPK